MEAKLLQAIFRNTVTALRFGTARPPALLLWRRWAAFI
jgi:hypothetical protein